MGMAGTFDQREDPARRSKSRRVPKSPLAETRAAIAGDGARAATLDQVLVTRF
jgi:hypothetical protein